MGPQPIKRAAVPIVHRPFVRSFTLPGIVDRRERSRLIVLMAAELEDWSGTPSVDKDLPKYEVPGGPPSGMKPRSSVSDHFGLIHQCARGPV